MAETHPILEAMAAGMGEAHARGCVTPVRLLLTKSELRAAALAAARVILSAEPSDATVWGACAAVNDGCDRCQPASESRVDRMCHASTADAIRASNAALLREIEGE